MPDTDIRPLRTTVIVSLRRPLIERCEKFGRDLAAWYAEDPRRRLLSSHGAERDPILLAHARMAECACCIYHNVDVETLNWDPRRGPDPGFDLAWLGLRLDAKRIRPGSRWLIWPVNKRHLYCDKGFDALVLVEDRCPDFVLVGWIEKDEFLRLKQEAPAGHKLDPGTWYVDRAKLKPIETLGAAAAPWW